MVIPVRYTYPHTGAHTRIHDNYVSFRALIRDSLTRVTEISFKKLIVCGAYGFTSTIRNNDHGQFPINRSDTLTRAFSCVFS